MQILASAKLTDPICICAAALSDTLRCILVLQEMFSALQSVETLLLQVVLILDLRRQTKKRTSCLR